MPSACVLRVCMCMLREGVRVCMCVEEGVRVCMCVEGGC